jgi:hypothetical protein
LNKHILFWFHLKLYIHSSGFQISIEAAHLLLNTLQCKIQKDGWLFWSKKLCDIAQSHSSRFWMTNLIEWTHLMLNLKYGRHMSSHKQSVKGIITMRFPSRVLEGTELISC